MFTKNQNGNYVEGMIGYVCGFEFSTATQDEGSIFPFGFGKIGGHPLVGIFCFQRCFYLSTGLSYDKLISEIVLA